MSEFQPLCGKWQPQRIEKIEYNLNLSSLVAAQAPASSACCASVCDCVRAGEATQFGLHFHPLLGRYAHFYDV